MNLQSNITTLQKHNETLVQFYCQYFKVPLDLDCGVNVSEEDQVVINFHAYKSNRETVLTLLGDVLGRSNWNRKLQYGNEAYSWEKEIGTIKVKIYDAETISKPVERPVATTDFPIQLSETAVA